MWGGLRVCVCTSFRAQYFEHTFFPQKKQKRKVSFFPLLGHTTFASLSVFFSFLNDREFFHNFIFHDIKKWRALEGENQNLLGTGKAGAVLCLIHRACHAPELRRRSFHASSLIFAKLSERSGYLILIRILNWGFSYTSSPHTCLRRFLNPFRNTGKEISGSAGEKEQHRWG